MKKVSLEAGRRPAGAARRQGAKPPGGAEKPAAKTARIQLHLGGQTVKRLNVHAALEGKNASREADRILSQWLKNFGKGREIFDSHEEGRDPAGDVEDDRPDLRSMVSDSGDEVA